MAKSQQGSYQLGIDVGGTFTDIVLFNEDKGTFTCVKTATTPQDPSVGLMNGLNKTGISFESIRRFVHASTFAVNLILERKGPKIGLVTTKGFRDVLELMREAKEEIYDFQCDKPQHLISRSLRVEVSERLDFQGKVIEPFNEKEAVEAVVYLKKREVEAIAVCFLFSFLDPTHELKMKHIIAQVYPGIEVTLSHEVLPEIREYERTSTTVINAYLKPNLAQYLNKLEKGVRQCGYRGDVFIFKSNGGITSLNMAKISPIDTISAGPAAGVIATEFVADLMGYPNVISVDMGGTSCDVSLIYGGSRSYTTEWEVEWGIPVKVPFIDVHSLGAGGGTIVWFDKAGALRVGPQSAGAFPGPVCYGHGGTEPTVTDSNLVLGRLNPDYFLGGDMRLSRSDAHEAIMTRIAQPMGCDVEHAAEGVLNIVDTNMIQAIRVISVERGFDPREFAMVAFGGAGAMHAVMLARALSIPTVLIPNLGGILSAFGLILADQRVDCMVSYPTHFATLEMDKLNELFASLEKKAVGEVLQSGFKGNVVVMRSADMRYVGQNFEINVHIPNKRLVESDKETIIDQYNRQYEKLYRFHTDEPRELLTLRVIAMGPTPKISLPRMDGSRKFNVEAPFNRDVVFGGKKLKCAIYQNLDSFVDKTIEGPLIIEKINSTVVVPPDSTVMSDTYGNLIIDTALRENTKRKVGNNDQSH